MRKTQDFENCEERLMHGRRIQKDAISEEHAEIVFECLRKKMNAKTVPDLSGRKRNQIGFRAKLASKRS
jgi:hypothetical protein